ncbi:MAG: hypothetical protein JNM61_09495 [Zoogloeaceae bacterium]|nr:hypothetical protein [Zoogloeaceae bacterium]
MKSPRSLTRGAVAVLACVAAGAAFAQASPTQSGGSKPPSSAAVPIAPASPTATMPPNPAAAPAAAAVPTPGATDLGDLEVIPGRANITLFRQGDYTCWNSVVRFRIRSKAAGDLKLMLFRQNFSATDANGGQLFRNGSHFVAGGMAISEIDPAQRATAFKTESGKLVSIAPKQLIEVQLSTTPNDPQCVGDATQEQMTSYRPKTMSLATALGVVDLAGNGDVKSISLLDMPLQVGTR